MVCRRARQIEVAGRDLDLDLRFEQGCQSQFRVRWQLLGWDVQGMLQCSLDGLYSQRDLTLGKMHQGEAGLWVPPDLVRREERLFRALNVSPAQPDAAQFGQRPPELSSQVGAKLLARQEGFLLCLKERPAQPEDLGAVDAAASVDAPYGLPV